MNVTKWSIASLKLTPLLKMMQIVPNAKQSTFSGCFSLFFPSFLKIIIFPGV